MIAKSPQTQPLWPLCPPKVPGEILPRLGGGQGFKILILENEATGMNVYRAFSQDPYRRCPACGNLNPSDSQMCHVCSHDLTSVQAAPGIVLIYESCDVRRLSPFIYLPKKQIANPYLLLPILSQSLRYSPEETRYQLILPENPAPTLRTQKDAPPLLQMLTWGKQLAQALETIHETGVALGVVDQQHILVQEHRAWLLAAPGWSFRQEQTFLDDVVDLANSLLEAMGLPPGKDGLPFLPQPAQKALTPVLNRALPNETAAQVFGRLLDFAIGALQQDASRRIRVAWASDSGRQRNNNEDSLLALNLDSMTGGIRRGSGVFAVADGAGGHEAGEIASQTAVQIIARHLTMALPEIVFPDPSPGPGILEKHIHDAIYAANEQIRRLRKSRGNNMLTTVTLAAIVGEEAIVANVGDSRVYLWRESRLQQLTVDHTTVQQLVDMEQISPAEARIHPRRHELYRALGHNDDPQPDIQRISLQASDLLLLCSDGLYDEVSDEKLLEILQNADGASMNTVQTLIQAANDAGGSDNISVILVQISSGK
jgi:protein phosphatase